MSGSFTRRLVLCIVIAGAGSPALLLGDEVPPPPTTLPRYVPPALPVDPTHQTQVLQRLKSYERLVEESNWDEAAAELEQLKANCEAIYGPNYPATVMARLHTTQLVRMRSLDEKQRAQLAAARELEQQADALLAEGKARQAQAPADEARAKLRALLGPFTPGYATAIGRSMVCAYRSGNFAVAAPLAVEHTRLVLEMQGQESLPYAESLCNLAMICTMIGNPNSEPLLLQAKSIYEQAGARNAAYALCLNNLGFHYASANNLGKAEPLLRTALELLSSQDKTFSSAYASCTQNLAMICARTDRQAEADELFKKSINASEIFIHERRRELQTTLRDYIKLLHTMSKTEDATSYEKRLAELETEDAQATTTAQAPSTTEKR